MLCLAMMAPVKCEWHYMNKINMFAQAEFAREKYKGSII